MTSLGKSAKQARRDVLRPEVVQYAFEHTDQLAADKFNIPKSTVNRWRREAKKGKHACAARGLHLMLLAFTFLGGSMSLVPEDVEAALVAQIEKMRAEGQEVHCTTVQIIARALCIKLGKENLLATQGGKLSFSSDWARRWLHSHGYVCRQATQAKEKKVFHEKCCD